VGGGCSPASSSRPAAGPVASITHAPTITGTNLPRQGARPWKDTSLELAPAPFVAPRHAGRGNGYARPPVFKDLEPTLPGFPEGLPPRSLLIGAVVCHGTFLRGVESLLYPPLLAHAVTSPSRSLCHTLRKRLQLLTLLTVMHK
jgi:hypothetical protein